MSGNKIIKPVTLLRLFQNQIIPAISMNETGYDVVDSKWQDLPMDILMRILMFVDDRTVIIASGVCTRWKEAIGSGVQELSLSWCKRNINNLVLSVVPKFTRLQYLYLYQYPTYLNDQSVEMVAKYCDDLRALDPSFSITLTDKALEALAHGCNLLEKLDISGCSGVTDSALIFLSEKCSKLSHLSLYSCDGVATDRGLLALAQNCCGLRFLDLACCQSVTDVGVTGLAKWCPELRVIDLFGCYSITDQSVLALAENCGHLRSLALPYNITITAVRALVNSNVHRAVKSNIKEKGNNSRYNSEGIKVRYGPLLSNSEQWVFHRLYL